MKRMLLLAAVLWTFLICFGVALAQAQHTEHGDPAGMTERDKCRSECHQKHCDQWRDCNGSMNVGAELEACHHRVEDDETRCQKTCEEPKT